MLRYAIKRGKSPEDCRRALDVLAMLEVKGATSFEPHPIAIGDFWKIHKAALDAKDEVYAALLLTAANACMYSGEVADLKWDDVDLDRGELATRRPKTKVARVAVLWAEVIETLKALPRQGEYLFYTSRRSYTTFSVLEAFRKYREAAGLGDDVLFSHIRDASYSIACRAAPLDKAKCLAGHRLGVSDHYILRNPALVREACDAVRREFMSGRAANTKGNRKTAKGKRKGQ